MTTEVTFLHSAILGGELETAKTSSLVVPSEPSKLLTHPLLGFGSGRTHDQQDESVSLGRCIVSQNAACRTALNVFFLFPFSFLEAQQTSRRRARHQVVAQPLVGCCSKNPGSLGVLQCFSILQDRYAVEERILCFLREAEVQKAPSSFLKVLQLKFLIPEQFLQG